MFQRKNVFIGLTVGCITFVLYMIYYMYAEHSHPQSLGDPTKIEMPSASIRMVTERTHSSTREISMQDHSPDSNRTMTDLDRSWNDGPTNDGMQDGRLRHLTNTNTTVTMLFWTSIYGTYPWVSRTHTVGCQEWDGYECVRTSEKSYFNDSNAVIFHARAGDLEHSVRRAVSLTRPLHQRWVLLANGESPANTPNLGLVSRARRTFRRLRGKSIVWSSAYPVLVRDICNYFNVTYLECSFMTSGTRTGSLLS